VIVAVPVLVVSAIEVAVTVTVNAELEAGGAMYVAELLVDPDRAPPPLTVQVTPALFLSFATVAVRLTELVASTVLVAGLTVTLGLALEPPQPDMERIAAKAIIAEGTTDLIYTGSSTRVFNHMHEADGPMERARPRRYHWWGCFRPERSQAGTHVRRRCPPRSMAPRSEGDSDDANQSGAGKFNKAVMADTFLMAPEECLFIHTLRGRPGTPGHAIALRWKDHGYVFYLWGSRPGPRGVFRRPVGIPPLRLP